MAKEAVEAAAACFYDCLAGRLMLRGLCSLVFILVVNLLASAQLVAHCLPVTHNKDNCKYCGQHYLSVLINVLYLRRRLCTCYGLMGL